MIEPIGISPLQLHKTDASTTKLEVGAASVADNFAGFLDQAMQQLNAQKQEVDHLTNQFMVGELEDVHQLTIANEKMLLGLELTVQIRNKAVEAYQEIMRMQI